MAGKQLRKEVRQAFAQIVKCWVSCLFPQSLLKERKIKMWGSLSEKINLIIICVLLCHWAKHDTQGTKMQALPQRGACRAEAAMQRCDGNLP